MMYIIKWTHGTHVSGILPNRFTSEIEAQEECDYQNRIYNSVNHWVEEES